MPIYAFKKADTHLQQLPEQFIAAIASNGSYNAILGGVFSKENERFKYKFDLSFKNFVVAAVNGSGKYGHIFVQDAVRVVVGTVFGGLFPVCGWLAGWLTLFS